MVVQLGCYTSYFPSHSGMQVTECLMTCPLPWLCCASRQAGQLSKMQGTWTDACISSGCPVGEGRVGAWGMSSSRRWFVMWVQMCRILFADVHVVSQLGLAHHIILIIYYEHLEDGRWGGWHWMVHSQDCW